MTPNPGAAIMNGFMHNVEGMIWGYFPFILFAMFACAALKKGLELIVEAAFRARPAVAGAVAASLTAVVVCLAWSAWFNWLQLTSTFSQGQSLNEMLASFQTAPLFIRMLTLVPLWTKVGFALGGFFFLRVLERSTSERSRRGAYR